MLQTWIHQLFYTWFQWVDQWGYWGVFLLMAMESSIIPVPSEIVMPPAAFWAAQGRMNFYGVVLAGTAGSYLGSILNYWLFYYLGTPLVNRLSWLIPPKKFKLAEDWVKRFGTAGVFAARLLPVVRHLISIPAGIFKMPVGSFSSATILGAGLWCFVLSWFGQQVIGDHPEVLQSPEMMISVMKGKMIWFIAGVSVIAALYVSVHIVRGKLMVTNESLK